MRAVANLLLTTALIFAFVGWCGLCIYLPMAGVQALGLPSFYEAVAALLGGGFGLAFALWSVAKLTGNRRV